MCGITDILTIKKNKVHESFPTAQLAIPGYGDIPTLYGDISETIGDLMSTETYQQKCKRLIKFDKVVVLRDLIWSQKKKNLTTFSEISTWQI